jgi:hypothetical protein
MSKRDDKLHEMLSTLEEGIQPEIVLKGEDGSSKVADLVNLAASIRNLAHPKLDQQTVQSDKRRLISAAREKYQMKQSTRSSNNGSFFGQWLFVPAVAGVALIVLMIFVLAAGVGLYFSGPQGAQAATLVDATGVMEVSDTGKLGDWHLVSSGDQVRSGQRLRTGEDSWVTLEFFDGTRTTLSPNTDLMLNKIDGNWGNVLQVELIQNSGETNHDVVPLQGDQATYQVLTPSGEASVRGTTFSVLVEDTGLSLFTVESGEVLVSNDGVETFVSAGQGVVTELGETLSSPTFLFTLQGELEDNEGKKWIVDGVEITIRKGTRIFGDPAVGQIVLVSGRITEENEWIAHSIDTPFSEGEGGNFTGVVTSAGEDGLAVNGIPLIGGDDQPQVAVGDWVRVTFKITADGWEVESLVPLDSEKIPDDDDDDNGDDDQDLEPELFFNPEQDKVTVCEAESELTREFTTTLNFVSVDENVTSIDTKLDSVVTEGDEFVAGVSLSVDDVLVDPDDIVTLLDKDETPVIVKVTVALNSDPGRVPPEAEIKVQVVSTEAIEVEPLSAHFEAKWECDEEIPDDEIPDDDDDGDKCTRDGQHPKALKLANHSLYSQIPGVTYDKIWNWFCQDNLGFGEIELGFKLYLQYEDQLPLEGVATIDDIFALRLGGMGWGQVKHEMARLARLALPDDEPAAKKEKGEKKEPPGKEKSEEAKNKEKPNNKNKKKDE